MKNGYLSADEILQRTAHLIGARTGLIAPPNEIRLEGGNPEVLVYTSMLSALDKALPHIELQNQDGLPMAGSGSSTTREYAKAKAICEALERYCNISYDSSKVVVTTADELGDKAVDLDSFPIGSDEEYANPAGSHFRPRRDQNMRWYKCYSLTAGKDVWVPFSSVYISTPFSYSAEAFTVPISTGSAIAGNYERAVVSGALEVMERDALSITWLQSLPLKQIDYSGCTNPEFWQRLHSIQASGIEQTFYDATMDYGLPTVYALQKAPNSDLNLLVMAATRFNMEDAMIRVMDEACSSRTALEHLVRKPKLFDPNDFASFTRLTDGAVFYGDKKNEHVFDFLMKNPDSIALEDTASIDVRDEHHMLQELIERCHRYNLDLIVADMTIPQLQEIGLYVVRVIIPQLMPLTTNYNMKYSKTPRLYSTPANLGFDVQPLEKLNPWPQPFA
ncbi:YcaO-like family protein [Aestuariibacter halophilus]|uniref:YcaO-like family protein n=1 Tax=Fluctibacter halophilus TaxID=226011 RepID=A0ABS8G6G6_9ALTE|nr:YcaO-like family protein [Aestuariibacter halophilus]MCC2616145.1 YcaO-like family protein [Aestuariibacter halophilus]